MSTKAYERVTAAILEQLEQGVVPWRRPWKVREFGAARGVAGHEYRGVNALVTELSRCVMGWDDPRFITFKAAKAAGGCVKKGERGLPVVYWAKGLSKTEVKKDGDPKEFMFAKGYTVFNVAQVEGLDLESLDYVVPARVPVGSPLPMSGMPCRIVEDAGNRAVYSHREDLVAMPARDQFESEDAFAHTLFHELAHATGHESRLNRKLEGSHRFGGKGYAAEELVAEIASAMVCAVRGVDPAVEQSAAYVDNWRQVLGADPKILVMAAARAQKAADFMLAESRTEQPTVERVERKRDRVPVVPLGEAVRERTTPQPVQVSLF